MRKGLKGICQMGPWMGNQTTVAINNEIPESDYCEVFNNMKNMQNNAQRIERNMQNMKENISNMQKNMQNNVDQYAQNSMHNMRNMLAEQNMQNMQNKVQLMQNNKKEKNANMQKNMQKIWTNRQNRTHNMHNM
jgi:hypothetical protein